MAIYGRKEKKIAKDVSLKKAYQKYYNEMRSKDRQPMTFYNWKKSGRRSGYFGSFGGTQATAKLRRSERKRIGLPD